MIFKLILCITHVLVHSMTLLVNETLDLTERNYANSEILSRIIVNTKQSTVFFMNLDSEILEDFVRSHKSQFTYVFGDIKPSSENFTLPKIVNSVVHIESYMEFEHFFYLIRPELFFYDGHFIIIYDRVDVTEMERIFEKFWKAYIYNVLILTTTNTESVSAFTYMPFAEGSCNSTIPIKINEFNKRSMKWTTNVSFPKKFKQLNRCPLRFGCYDESPGVIINSSESGLKKFSGMNVDLTITFSVILNFTVNILEYEQGMGVIYSNNSATKMLKRAIDNEVDFIFGSMQITRFKALDATRWVYNDKLVLVVTPALLIDPIQKIFLPFTFASWISIAMVTLVACCIIKLLKFTPKIVHDYVIGSNVKGSMLNVWNVLLGGNQQILPRSNFPRFLLVKFLIFTMIMRNLYQGGVFDILKRDVRGVELTTVDELIEHEFTFYVYPSLADRLQGSKLLQRHHVIQNAEINRYNVMTLNPSFNGAVFNYLRHVTYHNLIHRKNSTLRICKEIVSTNSAVFYFTKNFYLLDEFNELIQSLDSAGLITYTSSKYQAESTFTSVQKNPPVALTYRNIEGFFTLFYVGCVLALISFICEVTVAYVRGRDISRAVFVEP